MVKVYKCVFSSKEVCEDTYPQTTEYEDTVICVQSAIKLQAAQKFDIGDADDVEDADERGNNVVMSFNYQPFNFANAKEFMSAWKGYVKKVFQRVKDVKGEEAAKQFQKGAVELTNFINKNYAKFEFFSVDGDEENTLIPSYWKDEDKDEGPVFLIFKEAIIEQKC